MKQPTEESSILHFFSEIKDPRIDRQKLHKLSDIIFLTISASICLCEAWTEIEDFGNSRIDWLKKYIELPNGIPSHDTLGDVFSKLDPIDFQKCFMDWANFVRVTTGKEIISFDGKALNCSHDKSKNKAAIHIVNVWSDENQLVLGQLKVNEKSNEITAIPDLIDLLDIKDCVVTIDAMGTQKKIAKKITEAKAYYVLALKGNHGSFHNEVKSFFEDQTIDRNIPSSIIKTIEKKEHGHGRDEHRKYLTTCSLDFFPSSTEWENINSITMVISNRLCNGKLSEQKRYFISSLSDNELIAKAIRKHWSIENQLHWSLDVIWNEDLDRKRIGNSAENFSAIRKLSLSLLKQEKTEKKSINRKRLKATRESNYLEKILGF